MDNKPSMLLHSCCAPCSSAVLERLVPEYRVSVLYYNPNIYPQSEYLRRKAEQIRLIGELYADRVNIIDCEYQPGEFEAAAKGLEGCPEGGERCEACFRLRMEKTAQMAAEGGYSLFCTTLTVSPHKNAALINRVGRELSEKYGVAYLESDFKKKDGYLRSLQLSKQYGLYRQNYCGCRFSSGSI